MTEIVTAEHEVKAPWLQQEDESPLWYQRFLLYYLPLGPGRNLTQAYIRHLKAEKPERAERLENSGRYINTSKEWSEAARKYEWMQRAVAFDTFNAIEMRQHVQEAREVLIKNTKKAAETLVNNLGHPRQGVAAAKEILDRAGLPGAHVVGHGQITPYSADDFNKAQAEIADWEQKIRGEIVEGDFREPDSDGESESASDT